MEPIITTATLGKLILGATIGALIREVLDGDEHKTKHSYDTDDDWEDYKHKRDYEDYPDWNG